MNKTISISCIDTLNYTKSINAIKMTCANMRIDKVYWFSDKDIEEDLGVPVVWHRIDKIDINTFVHFTGELHLKIMPEIVDTDFNIINHYDGFAVNKDSWTDEFLDYDYIGAVWPWYPDGQNVGNGGFSLRSKKLYDAILDYKISWHSSDYSDLEQRVYGAPGRTGHLEIPEDVIICRIHRPILEQQYGIRFAPTELANRWSIENNQASPWLGKSLGFHGKFGIHKHYGVEI